MIYKVFYCHLKRTFLASCPTKSLSKNNWFQLIIKLHPEVQCHIYMGSPIIPILSQINPIPSIDAYFFKIYSDIVLLSTPRPS